ncbi:Proteasome subunit alpha type-4 [Brettanomyces bruxellensis]|uniref:Proteasome subunit alpha type n=1 Tax=Dekkera bruxellensis TaxID=5007 RepID=A0A7D9CV96_DEKBR|nr:Proteasome subunit alpha type-4 [Brettanomyces bruxellensis]VUG15913.1 PRE6 [Brettanomyces bruxellensis]
MSGYDSALSIFSPDGHVFQVEYALEAVKRGTCAVGVKGEEIVVLACERRTTLKLQDPRTTPSKINKIDNHVQLAFAGLSADARILIDKARVEAQSYRLTLEDPASIEYMTRYIAGVQQRYTQSGGTRPFGIATLVAGFDANDKTPRLYLTEPSGIYSAWKANSIGRSSKTVREFLEKNYDKRMQEKKENAGENEESTGLNDDETIRLAIEALLEVVQTGAKNIEICVMKPGKTRALTNEEISNVVKQIEDEKAAEEEKKKSHRRRD